jgi:ribosomal protein S25
MPIYVAEIQKGKKRKLSDDENEDEDDVAPLTARNIVVRVNKEVTRRRLKAGKIQDRINLILTGGEEDSADISSEEEV